MIPLFVSYRRLLSAMICLAMSFGHAKPKMTSEKLKFLSFIKFTSYDLNLRTEICSPISIYKILKKSSVSLEIIVEAGKICGLMQDGDFKWKGESDFYKICQTNGKYRQI
jgi:hypothetical protein